MLAHRARWLLTLVALVALPAALAAQTGMISGRVTDAGSNRGIAGARVQASLGDQTVASVIADENGDYRITGLSAGSHALLATQIGYRATRVANLNVGAGASVVANIPMAALVSQLSEVVTTASRAPERVLDAPARVSVINAIEINERPSVNITDHVVNQPGVDVARGGLVQANIVTRGFNNIFSGSLLTLTDNRFAFVPSLRVNIPYLMPTTNEDIERIEIVLGPGAALYGPNTAGGVLHVITKSPFASQGTILTVDGGNQDLLRGAVRTAWAPNKRFGFKVSADAFRGTEWPEFQHDSLERVPRDMDLRRFGGEARVDFRPTDGSEIIGTYGLSRAGSAVEPTGLGPAQVKDWTYQTFQLRGRLNRLFGQVFVNTSDAGETFLLRTASPTTSCPDVADPACIIDKSTQFVAQAQHGLDFGPRQRFLYGFDFLSTNPKTEGTINGRNEDDDDISEAGGYIHSVTQIAPMLELTTAARVDKHNRLESAVFSPRVALVFKPTVNQNLRLTYNRAFSTPSTNNLFLDLLAGRIPPTGTRLYGVRALGVPAEGLTFRRDCPGSAEGLCMRVPDPFGAAIGVPSGTQIPALAAPLYPVALGAAAPQLVAGLTASFVAAGLPPANAAAQAQGIVQFLGTLRPTPADVGTRLRILQPESGTFRDVDATDIRDVERIRPTIHNTVEIGYKGILGDRLQLGLDVWRDHKTDFVGPLIVETPNVFLDAPTLGAFLAPRLAGIGLSAAQAGQIATTVAGALGGVSGSATTGVPLGVVNFDHELSSQSDVIVTYRNFGELTVWGSDFSGELLLDRGFSVFGTYSWVNKDFFPRSEVGGVQDISLNAPASKGSMALRYRDVAKGVSAEIRGRHVGEFPVFSFINGVIETYNLLDASFSVRPSFAPNLMWSLMGTNLLNDKHREFVGGGSIGRLLITRLQLTL